MASMPRSSYRYHPSDKDINILLLGETGTGKTTFINAMINYLFYNTLDDALRNEVKVLIPSTYIFTDPQTFASRSVGIGNPDENEYHGTAGHSSTQKCRSYVFCFPKRVIRLIDGPGVGDTRGSKHEAENFRNIFQYISQYEHLNGICIFLKTDAKRQNINLRYCIKETLRHLHRSVTDNIMFIFTHARATFYQPTEIVPILKNLFSELHRSTGIQVSLEQRNAFCFDNEAFRYLAARKRGIVFLEDEEEGYRKSWDVSVKELHKLIARIIKCDLHAIKDTQSLNEALQLIQLISRPVAEITRLIQENISLAEQYQRKLSSTETVTNFNGIPQKVGKFVQLNKPMTVCISPHCTSLVQSNGSWVINYHQHCHEDCSLQNVVQECIGHPILKHCAAMARMELCTKCRCSWTKHMHITYRYETDIKHIGLQLDCSTSQPADIIKLIQQRKIDLEKEQEEIRHICAELSAFVKRSSIVPINDDLTEYMQLFLDEEKQKGIDGNPDLIRKIQRVIDDYRIETRFFTELRPLKKGEEFPDASGIEKIFDLVAQLYCLPINGDAIREQVERIKVGRDRHIKKCEEMVPLPINLNESKVLRDIKALLV